LKIPNYKTVRNSYLRGACLRTFSGSSRDEHIQLFKQCSKLSSWARKPSLGLMSRAVQHSLSAIGTGIPKCNRRYITAIVTERDLPRKQLIRTLPGSEKSIVQENQNNVKKSLHKVCFQFKIMKSVVSYQFPF